MYVLQYTIMEYISFHQTFKQYTSIFNFNLYKEEVGSDFEFLSRLRIQIRKNCIFSTCEQFLIFVSFCPFLLSYLTLPFVLIDCICLPTRILLAVNRSPTNEDVS